MKTLLCCLFLASAGCLSADDGSTQEVQLTLSDPSCSDSIEDWNDLCDNGIPLNACVGDIGELTCVAPGGAVDNLERFCDRAGGIFAFVLLEATCLFLEP